MQRETAAVAQLLQLWPLPVAVLARQMEGSCQLAAGACSAPPKPTACIHDSVMIRHNHLVYAATSKHSHSLIECCHDQSGTAIDAQLTEGIAGNCVTGVCASL